MEENRFSGLSFRQGMIKSGAKVSGGADPVVKIASTHNNFILAPKAMSLVGVAEGDYVVVYDLAGIDPSINDHYNNRFYLSRGFVRNGVQQGAKIGKNGQFSFNVAWGAMMAEDMGIKEITGDQLVDRNMAILREMELKNGGIQKSYIALKKGVGTLVPYGLNEEGIHEPTEIVEATKDSPAIAVPMFVISKIQFSEHTPKIGKDGAVVEEEEVQEEEV